MASYGVMSFLPPATLDPKLPNPRLPEGPEDVEAVEAAAEAAAAERSLPKSRTTPARVPDSSRNSAVSSPNQSEPPPVPKFLEEASFWIDSGSVWKVLDSANEPSSEDESEPVFLKNNSQRRIQRHSSI